MIFTKVEHADVRDGDQVVAEMADEVVAGTARRLPGCDSATMQDEQGQLRFLKFANEIYRIETRGSQNSNPEE